MALDFGGVDEYVDVGTMGTFGSNMDNPFTVSFWINTTSVARGGLMGTWNDGNTTAVRININHTAAGKIEFTTRDDDNTIFVAETLNDIGFNNGAWRHLVLVVDPPNNSLIIYLDGVSKAINVITANGPDNFSDFGYDLYIAAENVRGVLTRVGVMKLEDFVIYNKALSVNEVLHLWNSKRRAYSEVNCKGLWHFDEQSGATAHDFSGDGNTGTLHNMEDPGDWIEGVHFSGRARPMQTH